MGGRATCLMASAAIAVALAGCGGDEETTTVSSTVTDTSSSGTAEATTGPEADTADSEAQSIARAAQAAAETYATDNDGLYNGLDVDALQAIEPTVPDDAIVTGAREYYSITIPSPETGNYFSIEHSGTGETTFTCSEAGVAGCGEAADW